MGAQFSNLHIYAYWPIIHIYTNTTACICYYVRTSEYYLYICIPYIVWEWGLWAVGSDEQVEIDDGGPSFLSFGFGVWLRPYFIITITANPLTSPSHPSCLCLPGIQGGLSLSLTHTYYIYFLDSINSKRWP